MCIGSAMYQASSCSHALPVYKSYGCSSSSLPHRIHARSPGLLNDAASDAGLLRKYIPGKRVLIVTNETIAPLYLEK